MTPSRSIIEAADRKMRPALPEERQRKNRIVCTLNLMAEPRRSALAKVRCLGTMRVRCGNGKGHIFETRCSRASAVLLRMRINLCMIINIHRSPTAPTANTMR